MVVAGPRLISFSELTANPYLPIIQGNTTMTKTTFKAVLLAVAVAVSAGSISSTALAAGPTNSPAAAKTLNAANAALKAKKFDEVIGHLKEISSIAGHTPADTYLANQMLAYVYVTQNKYAEAAPILEAQLGSSFASAAEKNTINKQLLGIYFNLKNYTKVVELGQALVTAGTADGSTYNVMAQAYDKLGKLGDAVKFIKARVDAASGKGQKPAENELLLLLDYQGRMKDSAGRADTFEKLVSFYPKPQYWANIMPSLISAPENTDAVTINIYRLMASNGTLKQHTDYSEFAKLAIVEGAAGEAVNLVQKGLATNVFPEDRKASANRLLEAAKKQLAADQAGLAKTEADAKAAATGDADIRLGKTYYGMGQADKAIEAYKRGIAKGGLKSIEEAQLLLGIALVSQKKGAEASAAFQAARKGSDSKFANVARYWALNAK